MINPMQGREQLNRKSKSQRAARPHSSPLTTRRAGEVERHGEPAYRWGWQTQPPNIQRHGTGPIQRVGRNMMTKLVQGHGVKMAHKVRTGTTQETKQTLDRTQLSAANQPTANQHPPGRSQRHQHQQTIASDDQRTGPPKEAQSQGPKEDPDPASVGHANQSTTSALVVSPPAPRDHG